MAARLFLGRTLSSSLQQPSFTLKKNLAHVFSGGCEGLAKRYCNGEVDAMARDVPVLVRDFIDASLYDPGSGYFSKKFGVVGALKEPLQFNHLEGRTSYMKYLDKMYQENDDSWFTPAEIFQPWYGYAIGEYILCRHHSKLPLVIYEIGGGTGTCAKDILDYIMATAPTVYQTMKYVSVEISAKLANKQKDLVHKVKSHQPRYHVECRSGQDKIAWGPSNEQPCFIILLEVLDNLPHDLVYRENTSRPWMETWVSESNGMLMETRHSVNDLLIKTCLHLIENKPGNSENHLHASQFFSTIRQLLPKLLPVARLAWIPTGCLEMLQTLHQVRPNMSLIVSDFSSLPDVKISGERAPLVASKSQGVTKDHCTYLEAKGAADIFFPTDFQLLQKLDHHCANHLSTEQHSKGTADKKRVSSIVTSSEFMKRFARTAKTETKDGYNPLLEDFSNTKFYLSSPSGSLGSGSLKK